MPLPYVDEHGATVVAGADQVWRALQEVLDHAFTGPGAGRYARAVGCIPAAASGPRPLTVGSTVPGFRVVRAVPGEELALEGQHRFSTYALTFRIEPVEPELCHLRAETRAAFPGRIGRLYRALVVGTGGHVIAVRRLLAGVERRAPSAARS